MMNICAALVVDLQATISGTTQGFARRPTPAVKHFVTRHHTSGCIRKASPAQQGAVLVIYRNGPQRLWTFYGLALPAL